MSQLVTINNSQKEVSLICPDENLGEFISSLLGQPQSISKNFTKPFKADTAYFEHLLAVIFQRLDQQNTYELVNFNAKIKFKDGAERKLTSIDSFKTYAESMSRVSVRLLLVISLLVKFPNKEIPERQEISLSFDTLSNESSEIDESLAENYSGIIYINIEHTERTWADDMLTLIENSFDKIWIDQNKFSIKVLKFAKIISNEIASLAFMLLGSLAMIYSLFDKFSIDAKTKRLNEYLSLGNNNTNDTIGRKLDLIAQNVLSINDYSDMKWSMYLILAALALMSIRIILKTLKPYPSFVVLTIDTAAYMEDTLAKIKTKNRLYSGIVTLLVTLALGILGNYIYSFLINIFK
jgi:hypothetical protein